MKIVLTTGCTSGNTIEVDGKEIDFDTEEGVAQGRDLIIKLVSMLDDDCVHATLMDMINSMSDLGTLESSWCEQCNDRWEEITLEVD